MNKIEIYNFGPIKDATIDIKPMLVLIGPQASGKSTIAKLIFFFETLPEDLFGEYSQTEDTTINIEQFNQEYDNIYNIEYEAAE
ncbi:MAG: ATP-binding protein [Bacteroidales bacterium]|nr:ATP-binding protein [Bacteroidales bacterium]